MRLEFYLERRGMTFSIAMVCRRWCIIKLLCLVLVTKDYRSKTFQWS